MIVAEAAKAAEGKTDEKENNRAARRRPRAKAIERPHRRKACSTRRMTA